MSRSRIKSKFFLLAVSACAVLYCSCTGRIAGGTSETTNGLAAVVKTASGSPISHALVRLRPEGFLADTGNVSISYDNASIIDTFTDANGGFRIGDINPGKYSIEIQDGMGNGALLHGSVLKDSIIDYGDVVVIPAGSVRGYINRKSVAEGVAVYVRVYGMQRMVRADPQSGAFALYDMPHGDHVIYFNTSSPSYKPKDLQLTVSPDSVSDIGEVSLFPFNDWTYSRVLSFNTTSSGADIAGNVYAFPVLVRLAAGNFTFSQAKKNGEDIRFAKSDSTPLAYEIERWDGGAGRAEIWVKMDTIFGNSDRQYILMFWGNGQAASLSRNDAVFDTANGYQGVWHLSDGSADSIRDASANRYHGVSPDTARPTIAEGDIGSCRWFDGKSDFIAMPNTAGGKLNFPENSYYTVSAWVLVDTLDIASHLIVSKGYEQYYLRITSWNSPSPQWEFVEFNETTKWQTSTFPATSKQWTLLTGVRQGSRQILYCNGVLVDSTIVGWSNVASRNTSNNLSFGRFMQQVNVPILGEGYDFFKGSIDEVRILSVAQSPDWVRLCYMNQRSDDRLVRFK